MENELLRLDSFRNWTLNFPNASVLARAGFYYASQGDTVECYQCHCHIGDWKEHDSVRDRHRQISPDCPLVTSHVLSGPPVTPPRSLSHPHGDGPRTHSQCNSSIVSYPVTQPEPLSHSATGLHLPPPPSRQESQRRNPDANAHLKIESVRQFTYRNWPSQVVEPDELAKAGLYYLGVADCVRCAFCSGTLRLWEAGDEPFAEHKKHYPNCPFVNGLNVGNVTVEQSAAVFAPRRVPERLPQTTAPALYPECMENFSKEFSTYKARFYTFENQPLPEGQTIDALAKAGFYYVGPGDSVKCFQCGGVLKRWMAADEPWAEHAKWFSHCPFVLKEKGHEFISNVLHRFSLHKEVDTEPMGGTSRPRSPDTELKTLEPMQEEEEEEELTSRKEAFLPGSISVTHPLTAATAAFAGTTKTQLISIQPKASQTSSQSLSSSSLSSYAPSLPVSSNAIRSSQNSDEAEKVALENERLRDAILCKICMDRATNTVLLPCGHLLCCDGCAAAIPDCPVCRSEVKGTLRVYIS